MNGVLVVDKPAGPTSHDVVAGARRALGTSRIGHTGTLDPFATGVLPLVVGRATRLAQFLTADEKEYEAGVRFGRATRTYDADDRTFSYPEAETIVLMGPPPRAPADLDAARIEEVLPDFTGTYLQTPPPFSAKKISGVPAYKLARRNQPVAIRPVEVTVRSLVLRDYAEGLAQLHVVCSAGFYVRSLAHGLGERMGCGAHLESLRRTRAGDFTLDQAVRLEELEREGPRAGARMVPLSALLPLLPPAVVTEEGARRTAHGNALGPGDLAVDIRPESGSRFRVVDEDGTLLGIAERTSAGLLHPVVVLV
jgi:tRNA pseudouridine55 synthase